MNVKLLVSILLWGKQRCILHQKNIFFCTWLESSLFHGLFFVYVQSTAKKPDPSPGDNATLDGIGIGTYFVHDVFRMISPSSPIDGRSLIGHCKLDKYLKYMRNIKELK